MPRHLAGLPRKQVTTKDDIELRKVVLEHDRADREAVRAHQRELKKIAIQQANTIAAGDEEATRQFRLERLKTALAAEDELSKLYHQKIAETAIAGIDRSRDSAKFVQTAATAILGIYTGLLALAYSVTSNPLPLRGAWAGVFLGLAISFATAYLAFLTEVKSPKLDLDNRSLVQRQYSRTAYLTRWVKTSVHERKYAIRAAVFSLLFGVLFIAAPFLSTVAPVPDIAEPKVPQPPSQVAAGFEDTAKTLFEEQAKDYKAAVDARAAALKAAKTAAQDRKYAERRLNVAVSLAAVAALLVALFAPKLWDYADDKRKRYEDSERAVQGDHPAGRTTTTSRTRPSSTRL